jgi:outer membrane protein assembly factor BamB
LALRATDGHLVWRRDLGSPAYAQPSLAADRLYVPIADGHILALRVDTGEVVWERRLGGPATGLLALDDRVYAGSTDNFFYALNTVDGTVAWRWRTGGDVVGIPVIDERNVYFVSLDNVLRALSRKTGVQQWVRPLPLRPTRGPLKIDQTLVVSGVAPTVRGYNLKDGKPAGEIPASGELAGSPYGEPAASAGSSQILVVTRDIAKGATATLFVRQLGPPLTAAAPLPNAAKATFLDPVTPAVPEP